MGRSRWIADWDPEDVRAWESGNGRVARRNLMCSITADHVAFSIWSLWAVMALFMPQAVYGFTAGDKLLLGAVATFVGGCVRIPYTLGIARFGGRNWTIAAAVVLLIPTVATMVLLANPGWPLWPYVLCAALTGLGGGNYAASMANVNALYPQRLKGWALGLTAGVANMGVAGIQLVGLLVIAVAGNRQPYWVCAAYLVLLAGAAVAAAVLMDNVEHRLDVGHIREILSVPDTWVITFLYVCAFGSWIGFAFAFGEILQVNFIASGHDADEAALRAAQVAFVGPLLGAVSRIFGGKMADRRGGGRVTLAVFAGMFVVTGALAAVSLHEDQTPGQVTAATMLGYIVGFVALFVVAGAGNGSVFKLIPSVFEARSRSLDASEADRRLWTRSMSGALIGLASAVGALGGVGIDLTLRQSYALTGTETPALWVFVASYAVAGIITWRRYVRRPATAAPVGRPAQTATPQPLHH